MAAAQSSRGEPETMDASMTPHGFLGVVRASGFETTCSNEQRTEQPTIRTNAHHPEVNQRPVQLAAQPRQRGHITLVMSGGFGADGGACDGSRPPGRQMEHPGNRAAAGQPGPDQPPACGVGRVHAPDASIGCARRRHPDDVARQYPSECPSERLAGPPASYIGPRPARHSAGPVRNLAAA